MKMNYLVTGGTGFIGKHLVSKLLSLGNDVTVLTRKTNYSIQVDAAKGLKFIRADILKPAELEPLFASCDFDCVFHLSGISDIAYSLSHPQETHDTNVNGTLNILELMRKHDIPRMVFSSTAAVYGDYSIEENREDMPVHPLSPYAQTKYVGEQYCEMYSRLYDMRNISLRYFNVYGPGMKITSPAVVILKFIEAIRKGISPVIFGDGTQTRDFVYIDDVIRANICAAGTSYSGTYNIGSGVSTKINDLITMINQCFGTSIKPNYQTKRLGDIVHSGASIEKAKKELGYFPENTIENGIIKLIQSL